MEYERLNPRMILWIFPVDVRYVYKWIKWYTIKIIPHVVIDTDMILEPSSASIRLFLENITKIMVLVYFSSPHMKHLS